MITVLELLKSTAEYFAKHGIENPRLNIEHLLAHSLGVKRIELYMQFDRPLGEKELTPLREAVRKRAQGVPLQHLLGTVEFHGHTFHCDARALIARPETEQLVHELVTRLKASPPKSILDVGTGSGVIAISLALTWPEASVTAVDLSPAAIALAEENAAELGAGGIRLVESDLFAQLDGERFDLIVANLPYIPSGEIASLAKEVQADPHLALDGGPDGLAIIRRLMAEAPDHLRPGGIVALEIGLGQGYALKEFLQAHPACCVNLLTDYQGVERFLLASYG